jgi:hypothetical protein
MSHNHKERIVVIVLFNVKIFVCAFFCAAARVAAQQNRNDRSLTPAERARERQLRREAQMETGLMIEAIRRERRRPVKEEHLRLATVQL